MFVTCWLVNVLTFQGLLLYGFCCITRFLLIISSTLVSCNYKFVQLDYLSVLTATAQMQHLCVLDMREAYHFIAVNPLLTLWLTVYFKKLLSPVFRSCLIKAVPKLIVFILPMHAPAGGILVSTVDTLLQHCSLHILEDYILSLGPVHEKTPMNICCHPLSVEAWMLQLLTGEHT